MGVEKYTDLQISQEAHQLVLKVDAHALKFPYELPLTNFGVDAVDCWFSDAEISEIVAFTHQLAV